MAVPSFGRKSFISIVQTRTRIPPLVLMGLQLCLGHRGGLLTERLLIGRGRRHRGDRSANFSLGKNSKRARRTLSGTSEGALKVSLHDTRVRGRDRSVSSQVARTPRTRPTTGTFRRAASARQQQPVPTDPLLQGMAWVGSDRSDAEGGLAGAVNGTPYRMVSIIAFRPTGLHGIGKCGGAAHVLRERALRALSLKFLRGSQQSSGKGKDEIAIPPNPKNNTPTQSPTTKKQKKPTQPNPPPA